MSTEDKEIYQNIMRTTFVRKNSMIPVWKMRRIIKWEVTIA